MDHADIEALRDASGKMQQLSGTDNRSWIYWAEFHGFNRYDCWHHSRTGFPPGQAYPYDLFLPWHRAYLSFWQAAMRDQNLDAIQPWWDWTTDWSHQNGIPDSYKEDVPGGNTLASGPMPDMPGQPARQTRRNESPPSELPTQDDVDEVLDRTAYTDFSAGVQDLHDSVHGWVGGDMGVVATSAFDPIFWAHHTMIDRLWYLWQLSHGVNNIPLIYLDKALFPGYTVRQVLDVHELGYEYATSTVVATPVGAGQGGE